APTNTLTPLAESYSGSVPVFVIMSDIASALVGRGLGALHEVPNQIDCFRPVTRWAEALSETAAIAPSLAAAFDLTHSGRPGPVALSIPNDLLFARAETSPPAPATPRRPPCHVADVDAAARRLRAATRPLIITGGGVIAAGAERELVAVARRLDAPVISTVAGRGALDEGDRHVARRAARGRHRRQRSDGAHVLDGAPLSRLRATDLLVSDRLGRAGVRGSRGDRRQAGAARARGDRDRGRRWLHVLGGGAR